MESSLVRVEDGGAGAPRADAAPSPSKSPAPAPPPVLQQLAFAGVAAGVSTVLTNPIDVLKVRLQLFAANSAALNSANATRASALSGAGGASVATASAPRLVPIVRAIVRDEGVRAFAAGLSPALYRVATYSALRLGLYEPLRDWMNAALHNAHRGSSGGNSGNSGNSGNRNNSDSIGTKTGDSEKGRVHSPSGSTAAKIGAGLASGCVGAAVGSPLELLKVRMQSGAGDAAGYRSMSTPRALVHIARVEGVRALWNGAGASMLRAALLTAAQLATYDAAKSAASALLDAPRESLRATVAAAMAAGIVTTTVTAPADVIKTRMMRAAPRDPAAASIVRCAAELISSGGGPRALMRGWLPNYARLGPQSFIALLVYDWLRALAGWRQL